jgi:cell division GTPase FtsZ
MVTNNSTNTNIGFLGIGQCGGNVVEYAAKYGYTTAVINTSVEDLNTLDFVREKKLINNNGGCGKNRNEGIAVVKNKYKEMISFVENSFKNVNIIFVVFATGGGTGSGFTPILTDILSKKLSTKKFILIGVMPSNYEGLSAIDNNIECLRELYKLNLTTMLVDNEKFMAANKDKTRAELFDEINSYIVKNINMVFSSELNSSSKYGNLDKKDINNIFNPAGMMIISKKTFTVEDIDDKGLEQIILNCIDKHIYAPITKNKIISTLGVIFELPTDLMMNIDYSKITQEFGTPIDIFEGFRELPDDSDEFKVIVIMSGLSFPKNRIQEYNTIINDKKDDINSLDDEDDIFGSIKKDKNFLNEARKSSSTNSSDDEEDDADFDLENLFANYD